MRTVKSLSLLILVLASAADAATLRIVQAIPLATGRAAPIVDLYMDGVPLVGRLPYGQMTTLADAPAGIHSYSVRSSSGSVLVEKTLSFNGAAPLGHFLALAGDGINRPYALIAWQRETATGARPGFINVNTEIMHLAASWQDPIEVALSPLTAPALASRGVGSLNYQTFGVPSAGGISSFSGTDLLYQASAIDAVHGMVALRTPVMTTGDYTLTFVLIGNGSPATPFEWLTVSDTRIIAGGSGSYAVGPALPSTRYFAYDGRPGSGLYLDNVDGGDRLVGFLFGIGDDHRSHWQLLDGPRVGSSQYRLRALTPAANGTISAEWAMRFVTCDEVVIERYEGDRLVDTDVIHRAEPKPDCAEFRSL